MNEEEKKPKHRARRKKEEKPTPAKGLLDALKFIKPAQKKSGSIEQTHCLIMGHWMVASNGLLTIATPIQEDLNACPNTVKFEEALKLVGEDMSITQLTASSISVASGNFKAVVPCMPQLPGIAGPDPWGGDADENLQKAFKTLAPMLDEKSENPAFSAVLINGTKAVGTDGHFILEVEHGSILPPNVLVPKAACLAVAKCGKTLSGFGYTGPSCTFWFDDGSFIKTQLFDQPYPDYQTPLSKVPPMVSWIVTEEFFDGVKFVSKFCKDNAVCLSEKGIASSFLADATIFPLFDPMLTSGMIVDHRYLLAVPDYMDEIVFDDEANVLFFRSGPHRGMVMGVVPGDEV